MKLRCRFRWHDWADWEFIQDAEISDGYVNIRTGERTPTGKKYVRLYERKCKDCKTPQTKTIDAINANCS